MKLHLHRSWVILGLVLSVCCRADATGYYGPNEFLLNGGSNAVTSPEFYWDLEVKRLAKDYHPIEKPFAVSRDINREANAVPKALIRATSDADQHDFADAIKTGELKPQNPAEATTQHNAARAVIDGIANATLPPPPIQPWDPTPSPTPSPTTAAPTGTTKDDGKLVPLASDGTKLEMLSDKAVEIDSEFADYDRGAFAYHSGKDEWDTAEKEWKNLLNRPAAERHYRTVWAAFMLGKMAMKAGRYPEAVKWFQQTRQFAKDGFADSLGMAADSYGWEGRCEWKQGHSDKAARLFLTQLALGDESAIVSLKALIPDREPLDEMLNFGANDQPVDTPTPTPSPVEESKLFAQLKTMAADPVLRRLETVHILAAEDWTPWDTDLSVDATKKRLARWLKVIETVKPADVQDAEYLGWVAYGLGDYTTAEHWLRISGGASPMAIWLDAKLKMRAGEMDAAAKDLASVIGPLQEDNYTGWNAGAFENANIDYINRGESEYIKWTPPAWASGDLGAVHLARNDFTQALDVLLKADLWEDAAFVAERVLTADELKTYVDQLPPPPSPTPTPAPSDNVTYGRAQADSTTKIRYLLGRRLVREDRYAEAIPYLPAPYNKVCEKYAQALKSGEDASLPKEARGKAFFTAAWIARYDGMEIMGTEVAPDSFLFSGDFQSNDLTAERLSGQFKRTWWELGGVEKSEMKKNPLPSTSMEDKRLKTNLIDPDKRWHYRYIAAALAIKAAHFLDDNTEELADAVNTAGMWIKDLDDKKGDTYFQLIDHRCPQTTIGKADIAAHWFVEQTGPLSSQEKADNDKLVPPSDSK